MIFLLAKPLHQLHLADDGGIDGIIRCPCRADDAIISRVSDVMMIPVGNGCRCDRNSYIVKSTSTVKGKKQANVMMRFRVILAVINNIDVAGGRVNGNLRPLLVGTDITGDAGNSKGV